jgi:aspartyl-tRNA(Asn)/glutamyl-tRNA(Gln) amidotransferase subunit B
MLNLTPEWVSGIRAQLPELPSVRRERLVNELGLNEYDANVLVSQKELVDYFETGLKSLPEKSQKTSSKPLVNWITTELLGRLNAERKEIKESPVSSASLAELVDLIQAGTLSGKMAKEVFAEIFASGESPKAVVAKKGLSQVSNEGELLTFVDEVIKENPKSVEDVKAGKERAIGALVGALMKKTKGRANPQLANELLKKRIGV